ncbi:alpha beta-hydrolase [Polyplosphaeria fusca]|uniref:Alpha beta-hydrolase n=1 Tax=Polyplosphaeria fusca TaxID=682080 RepID=A0A9P4UYM4_9PLEO|nr:alpha beta-hydrolase [Polyplosphaeria fusca]
MSKPSVLFVHGSFHTPKHFALVRSIFEDAGYHTSCPQHPSVGNLPPIGLMEDAQCIRDELKQLIHVEEKDVIVIAHSYGGAVSTQALDKLFAKKERTSHGQKGGVVRLVYMCAFLLPLGHSLTSALGGELPPFIPVDEQGMSMMLEPERRFYHDLSPEDQEKWVGELLKSPAGTQQTEITQTAYLYHPVTYLYCEEDQALPLEMQKMMVENAKKGGVAIAEETCKAGHSPFLSMPKRLLELVDRIVKSSG